MFSASALAGRSRHGGRDEGDGEDDEGGEEHVVSCARLATVRGKTRAMVTMAMVSRIIFD